jgi:hypothetical protein
MTIPETLLTFVGAPAAIIGVVALAVYGPSEFRTSPRYRPGRPWPHEPAWYVPHTSHGPADSPTSRANAHALENGAQLPQIAAGDAAHDRAIGGASGEW